MSLIDYLKSKVFFKQLLIAIAIVVLIVVVILNTLSFFTKHNQEITVPNLAKLSMEEVEEKLDELNLDYVLLDTMDFHKDFPIYSVVMQDPKPGDKVKEDRKIYIKINSEGFKYVVIPNLIEKTFRQAEPTLKSLGLQLGKVTYKPYLGKDMVLEMWVNGKKVKAGTEVMKTTKVDLVLGDGKIGFEEESIDTTTILEGLTDEE
jgi:beta-lactam-binding protein with PASTA domain